MEYKGKYNIFDQSKITTFPISERENKVKLHNLLDLEKVHEMAFSVPKDVSQTIDLLAYEIVSHRKKNQPVMLFTGAHMIKNGLGRLLIDLIKKDMFTCISGNMATSIHDFELAMIGETSEYVPQALEKGQFGMAYEFSYMNAAISLGQQDKLGLGEALGKTIVDDNFRSRMLAIAARKNSPGQFLHPEVSVLATCYKENIPFTIHASIGTDVLDQHPSFDGAAKGACSARDFLIYTQEITKLADGGMVLNIGSAVTGPEVFLKAASMTGNIGKVPKGIVTADFDIRPFKRENIVDESTAGYYNRDQKSIVVRVPEAYRGKGYYVQGNQKQTFPLLYKKITERL